MFVWRLRSPRDLRTFRSADAAPVYFGIWIGPLRFLSL
jgi:hypothetical protein